MCVNINLGISSAGLPGVSGMASQVRGVLKHPEHHARHATVYIVPTMINYNVHAVAPLTVVSLDSVAHN